MSTKTPTPEELGLSEEAIAAAMVELLNDVDAIETAAVRRLLDRPDRDAFLRWASTELPALAPALFDSYEEPRAKLACLAARKLWNAMPVEDNAFEPVPMPLPTPDAPCPCSGTAFQACCNDFTPDMPMFGQSLWPALAATRPHSDWQRLAGAGKLPDEGLLHIATYFEDAGEPQHVVDLLAPRVRAGGLAPDHCLHVMDQLSQAFRALDRIDDEDALLRRFAANEDASVRAVAHRRLAGNLHAEGRRDRAWRHFNGSLQAAPDDPVTGLQELVLLTNEERLDEAEERAAYWSVHLREVGVEPDDPFLDIVDCFENDAQHGRDEYHRWFLSPALGTLVDWIDEAVERPLPTPKWRRMTGTGDDEVLRNAYIPAESAGQRRLERQWHEVGADVLLHDPDADDDLDFAAVLRWLEEHPEAIDSFVILADLAAFLEDHALVLGGDGNRWYLAIVQRGADMLERSWPDDRHGTTPWVVDDNRPALSLLGDYVELLDEGDDRYEDSMALYLRLNPDDNHGVRTDYMNLLLRASDDAEAVALGERYPRDMFAETSYGRALALYRLGREDEAAKVLNEAVKHLPLVLKYLLRNRIERPAEDEHGLLIGGEFQAWQYREDMREIWLAVPGMRDWLKQFVDQAQTALRRQKSRRRRR